MRRLHYASCAPNGTRNSRKLEGKARKQGNNYTSDVFKISHYPKCTGEEFVPIILSWLYDKIDRTCPIYIHSLLSFKNESNLIAEITLRIIRNFPRCYLSSLILRKCWSHFSRAGMIYEDPSGGERGRIIIEFNLHENGNVEMETGGKRERCWSRIVTGKINMTSVWGP